MKIRKAVIPAAGLGTRFLPATKTIPKEMLPIVDKPILQYIVEEVVSAGISDVVLIAGRAKTAIEDFFDRAVEVEDILEKTGRHELLRSLQEFRQSVNVISVRQQQALGLGHAVLCAQPIVGREPFAVLLGDEIMLTKPGKASGIGQLVQLFDRQQHSTVAVMEVPESEVSKYGIIRGRELSPNVWRVEDVIEKPSASEAPSRLALPGRYVFDAEIFEQLKNVKPGRNNEIQLTDGMSALAKSKGMSATILDTIRFDAGDKLGFLQANIEVGLNHPEIGPGLKKYLQQKFGGKT